MNNTHGRKKNNCRRDQIGASALASDATRGCAGVGGERAIAATVGAGRKHAQRNRNAEAGAGDPGEKLRELAQRAFRAGMIVARGKETLLEAGRVLEDAWREMCGRSKGGEA